MDEQFLPPQADNPAPQPAPNPYAAPNPVPIYPEVHRDLSPGDRPPMIPKLPKDDPEPKSNHTYGVTVVAVITILLALYSLTGTSADKTTQIAAIVDILLSVGLFVRSDLARKITLVLLVIVLVLQFASIFQIRNVRAKLNGINVQYQQIVKQDEQKPISTAERQFLNKTSGEFTTGIVKLDKIDRKLYISLGIIMAWEVVQLVYLTRPKVKAVFK